LLVLLLLLGQLDDHGVEHVADASLRQPPGEGAQADTDLVGRDPGPGLVVDGVRQILDQAAGRVGDRADRLAGGAQHRVADQPDGADRHRGSAPGAWRPSPVLFAGAELSVPSVPRTRWVTSRPGTTLRSTVHPAATAREKTV